MVTTVTAREAMLQRFLDNWTGTDLANVTFDGEQFVKPSNQAWVRVSIRHNASQQETLGGTGARKFMRSGLLFVQVFTPVGQTAVNAGIALAQEARTIYEGVHFSGNDIRFLSPIIREIGPEGAHYLINVECPFNYDERK